VRSIEELAALAEVPVPLPTSESSPGAGYLQVVAAGVLAHLAAVGPVLHAVCIAWLPTKRCPSTAPTSGRPS